ncbi:unnamed protein product [Meloidogyne enterolobii]|uniref:Uncharacterized protein n=1 Tax=Meloidogyne enterolobii TaxID=390850 RepID=A0ACB1AMZ1_MELEN
MVVINFSVRCGLREMAIGRWLGLLEIWQSRGMLVLARVFVGRITVGLRRLLMRSRSKWRFWGEQVRTKGPRVGAATRGTFHGPLALRGGVPFLHATKAPP